jgi:predicted permease
MLKSISWQTFLTITTVLLVIYYVAISVFFYSYAIRKFFRGRLKDEGQVQNKEEQPT